MKAVVIGPGRVGCGFAGHQLHRSGFEVSFVGRLATVERLQLAGGYTVQLTDGRVRNEEHVRCHQAVDIADTPRAAALVAAADVVGVAVGARSLTAVATLLAEGLAAAARPVNVLAFENAEDAGPRLRDAVADLAGRGTARRHGFSGVVVNRVVARRVIPAVPGEPIVLVGEPVDEFVVDGGALRRPLPEISGMRAGHFEAAFRSKLYRYSAGHATAAYLGYLKGYRYLHAAILDPEISVATRAAIVEGQEGLRAAYGPEWAGTPADVDAILARFANAALGDTVSRVGRDSRRKLGPTDRLVGAARCLERAGVPASALACSAAAALCFGCAEHAPLARPSSPDADVDRVSRLLSVVSGLPAGHRLSRRIQRAWSALAGGGQDGNLLLSLREPVWAWSREPDAALAGAR